MVGQGKIERHCRDTGPARVDQGTVRVHRRLDHGLVLIRNCGTAIATRNYGAKYEERLLEEVRERRYLPLQGECRDGGQGGRRASQ